MSGISLGRTAVHVGKRILELHYKLNGLSQYSVCNARPLSSAFYAFCGGHKTLLVVNVLVNHFPYELG